MSSNISPDGVRGGGGHSSCSVGIIMCLCDVHVYMDENNKGHLP